MVAHVPTQENDATNVALQAYEGASTAGGSAGTRRRQRIRLATIALRAYATVQSRLAAGQRTRTSTADPNEFQNAGRG